VEQQVPQRAPMCGCDGASYWNLSVAQSHGMAIDYSGACQPQMPCTPDGIDCPAALFCNVQVDGVAGCISPGGGSCWGLPDNCGEGGLRGRSCDPGSLDCQSACQLIKTEQGWRPDQTCN
jgi:hypothetical protein